MDKNFIIAILLTTLIIIIYSSPQYQKRFGKELPPKPADEKAAPKSPTVTPPSGVSDNNKKPGTQPSEEEPPFEPPTGISQLNKPEREEIITLKNDFISVDLSSRGGAIVRATMNNFTGISEEEKVQLVLEGQTWCAGEVSDGDVIISFSDLNFNIEYHSKESVSLAADLTSNARIVRLYTLDPEGFMLHTKTLLEGKWNDPVVHYKWNGPLNNSEAPIKYLRIFPFSLFIRDESAYYRKISYLGQGTRTTIEETGKKINDAKRIFSNGSAQKLAFKKNVGAKDTFNGVDGDLDWYAVRNKYFTVIAIPEDPKRWNATSEAKILNYEKWLEFTISKHRSAGDTALDIYIGPISYNILKSYDNNLTEIMELSWRFIRPLSIAFLWIIKKMNRVIPNWGLVIIIFSIFIKVVLYPLSKTSLKSMHKMSSLQPQITVLKEKYKNNPQKQHAETMALYKREGINPLGGCLPMLLQLPVFIALYPIIGRAFELRKAMFIPHWIEDLSRPDPFYIFPVAMGISVFLQSKTTMKDPNQKAMLYIMPVMMVVLFSNFSSGLTLYWFMFNVMTFIQQKLIKV